MLLFITDLWLFVCVCHWLPVSSLQESPSCCGRFVTTQRDFFRWRYTTIKMSFARLLFIVYYLAVKLHFYLPLHVLHKQYMETLSCLSCMFVFKVFQLNYLFLAECELVGTACSGSFQQFLALYTARENKQNKSKNNTIPGNAHQQESKTQIFIMLNKCYPTE